jgi:hypothetical protein
MADMEAEVTTVATMPTVTAMTMAATTHFDDLGFALKRSLNWCCLSKRGWG